MNQAVTTHHPASILTTLIAKLNLIESRNGTAATSRVTISAAYTCALASLPGNVKPNTSGNFSKEKSCATAIRVNNATKNRLTFVVFFVFGGNARVGCTKKLIPVVYATWAQREKCCHFHHSACALSLYHVFYKAAKVTKTNINSNKKLCCDCSLYDKPPQRKTS